MRGDLEAKLLSRGWAPAGVDEVGRGCLAGPVYASCVVLDYKKVAALDPEVRDLLRDSKTLKSTERRRMISIIKECSHSFAIGLACPREIEQINILQASFLAMRRAVEQISHPFDLLLVDGNAPVSEYSGVQKTVVKGDNHCFAIAAASILAKEARDQYMTKAAEKHPEYGFDSHVGYGTAKHIDMIHKLGICDLHRRTFAPINKIIARELPSTQSPLS